MKSTLILLMSIIVFVALSGCNKQCNKKCMSKCMEDKICEFKKTNCHDGVCVKEYLFQSKTVYVFDPGKCGADMTSEVIDEDCNTLGYLGGIMGNSKINGEDFSNATFITTSWKN